MAFPGGLYTITVVADYSSGGGPLGAGPVPGEITFTPSAQLVDTTDHVIVPMVPVVMRLVGGIGSVELVCTDNPSLSPSGWTWTVSQSAGSAELSWSIALPHTLGAQVNLDDLAPVTPQAPTSTLYGVLASPNTNTWASTQVFAGPVAINGGLSIAEVDITDPPGGTVEFLRADGAWAEPAGSGGGGVQIGGDLGGEDADPLVISTHLAAPLPTAQGGTGAASLTAAGVVTTSSAATTVKAASAYGAVASVGTDTTYAREDHTHGLPALPAATTGTAGIVQLDGTPSDIEALAATASPGATGKASDAGHVHPNTGLIAVIEPSGDTTGATDAAAITAACTAANSAGGGLVRLAAGTFHTTLITLPSNVTLEGAGSGATLVQLAAGQNTDLIQTTNFATLTGTDTSATPYGFQIRGMTLDGNKAAQSAGSGNCLSIYAYGFRLKDVVARNAMGWGIWSEWGSASAFLGPNGMESFASDIKSHDNDAGALTFIGPHDSQWSDVILVQDVNYTTGKTAFQVPTDGRANGSVFRGVHVYGGAYDYGVLAASAGVTFEGCQFEGALVAQMLVKASQVVAADCRWFWGSSTANTAKGIVFGDAEHTNLNGLRFTGKVENCSGGAIDLTYATGGANFYELLSVYVSPFTVPSPAVISTPGANDVALILVTDNAGVATGDSVFQVPNLAKLGSLSIAGVSVPSNVDTDPLGYGYATTHPWSAEANGSVALFDADAALFQQLIGYGMTISGLRIYVGTSSGNISVGLYSNGGQPGANRLPDALEATSGPVPCPAAGEATVTLTDSVTVGRSWYGALSCDNTTAAFLRSAPSSAISSGVAANQGGAHPLPATASAANGGGTLLWMATP